MTLEPGLYITATPIGNLGDITYRAVECLRSADLILCEDTRQTAKLCDAYTITTRREAYHDHNGARRRPAILERLENGAAICLVSDAGTPLISDPGFKLVREAREREIMVTALPGACAAITGLSIAGFETNQFSFLGFLPTRTATRRNALKDWASVKSTLVFYEGVSRIEESLRDIQTVLGERRGAIARELTKRHEEVISGTISELITHTKQFPLRGEFVLIIEGAKSIEISNEELDQVIITTLKTMSVRECSNHLAKELNLPRKRVYQRALDLKSS